MASGIPHPYTAEHARSFLARARNAAEARTGAQVAIRDAETDEALGSIALYDVEWDDRNAKVGYLIGPTARGRGAATRALRLVIEWAFAAVGLQRLELSCDPGNAASLKVIGRTGFIEEGRRRSCYETSTGRRDLIIYGLLPSDPRPRRFGE